MLALDKYGATVRFRHLPTHGIDDTAGKDGSAAVEMTLERIVGQL